MFVTKLNLYYSESNIGVLRAVERQMFRTKVLTRNLIKTRSVNFCAVLYQDIRKISIIDYPDYTAYSIHIISIELYSVTISQTKLPAFVDYIRQSCCEHDLSSSRQVLNGEIYVHYYD